MVGMYLCCQGVYDVYVYDDLCTPVMMLLLSLKVSGVSGRGSTSDGGTRGAP